MADEGRGYRVIVKLNLPPEGAYHSGHSMILQGDSVDEVWALLRDLAQARDDAGWFADAALRRFATFLDEGIARDRRLAEAQEEYS